MDQAPCEVSKMLKTSRKVPFLAVLCMTACVRVNSTPICALGYPGCHVIPLEDLFDRVIQHSARMHRLSYDLHSEYEQCVIPSKNQTGIRKCHTSIIETPNEKEKAQKLEREELTELILKLLMAWGMPLAQLHENMAKHEDNTYCSSKTLEMSVMLRKLVNAVHIVAEKMQLLGLFNKLLNGPSLESLNPVDSAEVFSGSSLNLLHCFRRDSDKILSYLKILKCRILPENDC